MKTITKLQQIKAPAEKKKLRVAAYCRVSTGSDAQLESLDTQKTYFENYINSRNDWELAGIYYDEGITGTKKGKENGPASAHVRLRKPSNRYGYHEVTEPLFQKYN